MNRRGCAFGRSLWLLRTASRSLVSPHRSCHQQLQLLPRPRLQPGLNRISHLCRGLISRRGRRKFDEVASYQRILSTSTFPLLETDTVFQEDSLAWMTKPIGFLTCGGKHVCIKERLLVWRVKVTLLRKIPLCFFLWNFGSIPQCQRKPAGSFFQEHINMYPCIYALEYVF